MKIANKVNMWQSFNVRERNQPSKIARLQNKKQITFVGCLLEVGFFVFTFDS